MKIGHHCPHIWAPGGVASYVRTVSDWQRSHGLEVVFLTGNDGTEPDAGGRFAEPVANGPALLQRAGELDLNILHTHLLVDAELASSPVPVLRTVHGHQPYCPSGSRYLQRPGRPCDRHFSVTGCLWGHVVNRCGSVRPQKIAADFMRTRREMASLRGVPLVAVSGFIRDQLVADGYAADLIDVLHSAASHPPTTFERVTPIRPRFVFVGRVAIEKGIDWLIRSVATMRSTADVDVIGDGPRLAAARQLAAGLGVAGRIRFHGWLDRATTDRHVAAGTALVVPSVWHEPFGLVAIEAMRLGVPVITSRVGGIPELVAEGRTGWLVAPNDVAGLAAAMDELATDVSLTERLGRQARADNAGRFCVDDYMARLMAAYARAIALHREARAA